MFDWLTGLFGSPGVSDAAWGGPPAAPPISTSPLTSMPGGPTIGESLTPKIESPPLPNPRPAAPMAAPTAVAQAAPTSAVAQNPMDKIAAALRGVQAPPAPDVVKPSTPHGPPIQHIQGNNLATLLQQLYPQITHPAPAPTLGGALGTGRY